MIDPFRCPHYDCMRFNELGDGRCCVGAQWVSLGAPIGVRSSSSRAPAGMRGAGLPSSVTGSCARFFRPGRAIDEPSTAIAPHNAGTCLAERRACAHTSTAAQ
jgi:hypothetical protein